MSNRTKSNSNNENVDATFFHQNPEYDFHMSFNNLAQEDKKLNSLPNYRIKQNRRNILKSVELPKGSPYVMCVRQRKLKEKR